MTLKYSEKSLIGEERGEMNMVEFDELRAILIPSIIEMIEQHQGLANFARS